MVTFRRQDRERVASGEITVTFRLWKSAHVKAGHTYRSGDGAVLVEDVGVIPAALVTRADVRRSGCPSVAAVWELAGEHTHAHVGPDTLLYRVQFRYASGPVHPAATESAVDLDRVRERLAKIDVLSARGPWTLAFLRVIKANPQVPARLLAAELGWERLDFKAHVRKLKALSLTVSYEIGYDLSDVGRAYLASTAKPARATRRPRSGAARSPRTRARSQ